MGKRDSPDDIFYGICSNSNYPISIEEQKNLFRLLFFAPSVTYEKVNWYLTDPFYFYNIDGLKKKLIEEIELIVTNELQGNKKFQIELHLTFKLKMWITKFSLPTAEEIYELAQAFFIPEIYLYNCIYRFYLIQNLTSTQITEYLSKYSEVISEKMINEMLEKLFLANMQKNKILKKIRRVFNSCFF